ncbi:MAG: EAL domain-containing response regulator [Candidatus Omnitrophica bacterium]|nr:EAL domain-containing response regulator [Candidatus Omnitrophota bacterium]
MKEAKTILMIDDEVDFLSTTQFLLESSNFKVITASTPHEGLRKALLKPDLILLDINMPEMDGLTVCKRLKENKATEDIPIIMLTLNTTTLEKVTAFDFGVADYMGKQFPFEEMLVRIQAVLKTKSPEKARESVEEKNRKISDLRDIVQRKNLQILFQPIVLLKTGVPIGYEALARGPKGTLFENPADLFTFATDVNMFNELDSICRDISIERAVFLKSGEILFLNIDPAITGTPHFKKLKFLNNSKIAPSQICLEITERTFVKNFPMLSMNLKEVRSEGVRVAIDDIGEGYSSLNAIAELRPEFIKIDINIIRNMETDSVKQNLVRLVADLARNTNSRLIGEGIETKKECDTLLSLGVEYGQGYHFSKPFCV